MSKKSLISSGKQDINSNGKVKLKRFGREQDRGKFSNYKLLILSILLIIYNDTIRLTFIMQILLKYFLNLNKRHVNLLLILKLKLEITNLLNKNRIEQLKYFSIKR